MVQCNVCFFCIQGKLHHFQGDSLYHLLRPGCCLNSKHRVRHDQKEGVKYSLEIQKVCKCKSQIQIGQDCLLQGQAQLHQKVIFCFSTIRLRSNNIFKECLRIITIRHHFLSFLACLPIPKPLLPPHPARGLAALKSLVVVVVGLWHV